MSVAQPRISVNKLAEFMVSKAARQRKFEAAAMIARLVAERDAARDELAQWVEVPRLTLGKVQTPPQE